MALYKYKIIVIIVTFITFFVTKKKKIITLKILTSKNQRCNLHFYHANAVNSD